MRELMHARQGARRSEKMAAHLNGLGVTTARGSTWTAASVQRVLRYIEDAEEETAAAA